MFIKTSPFSSFVLQKIFSGRRKHIDDLHGFQYHDAVGNVSGNQDAVALGHFLCFLPYRVAAFSGNDVGDLLVGMRMGGNLGAFFKRDLTDHQIVTVGQYLAADAFACGNCRNFVVKGKHLAFLLFPLS